MLDFVCQPRGLILAEYEIGDRADVGAEGLERRRLHRDRTVYIRPQHPDLFLDRLAHEIDRMGREDRRWPSLCEQPVKQRDELADEIGMEMRLGLVEQ